MAADLFAKASDYIVRFVASVHQISRFMVRFPDCFPTGSVQPDRMFNRNKHPHMAVEYKGINAFNVHHDGITKLAGANGGQGMELLYSSERVARSIIMKTSPLKKLLF